jgi:hypothetical protein
MRAALIIAAAVAVAGCDTLGPIIGQLPAVPACEPTTGQTFELRMLDAKTANVRRAATADPACASAALTTKRIEGKWVCRVSDGQSFIVAWDASAGEGVGRLSGDKWPGCTK